MSSKRFSRTELIIGAEGLDKLKNSKVAVFGVGGVGSYTVEALARTGVGTLVLVDFDVVDITNINRQLHALDNTVGQVKVELMAQRIKLINPSINVIPRQSIYNQESTDQLLTPDLDYVVDAIDTVTNKLDLIKRCVQMGLPLVSSMGAGNKIDPSCLKIGDIAETSVCPLAKVVRRELRKAGITTGVKVVYSTERPIKPPKEMVGVRQPTGSICFVPAAAGLFLASVVVRDLLYNRNI